MFHRSLPLLTSAAVLLLAVAVNAQPAFVGGALEPGFGVRTLSGSLTGEVDAGLFGETDSGRCAGFVATSPNHRITLNDDMPDMIVHLETYGLLGSLVVHGPGGTRCSGVPTRTLTQLEGPWPAGQYSVYIGTVSQYDWLSYELHIAETETALVPYLIEGTGVVSDVFGAEGFGDSMAGVGVLGSLEGVYGSEYDMFSVVEGGEYDDGGGIGGVVGGLGISGYGTGSGGLSAEIAEPVEAVRRAPISGALQIDPTVPSVLSFNGYFLVFVEGTTLSPPDTDDCQGWFDSDPTYALTLRSAATSLALTLDSPSSPAMVVAGPINDLEQEPNWYCTADEGTSASLSSPWPAGTYLIWLGTGSPSGDDFTFTIRSD